MTGRRPRMSKKLVPSDHGCPPRSDVGYVEGSLPYPWGRWGISDHGAWGFQTGDDTTGSSPGATASRSRSPGGSGGGTSSGGSRSGTGPPGGRRRGGGGGRQADRRLNRYRRRPDRCTLIDSAELPEAMRRAGRLGPKPKRDR